jgi:hypothetical protein
MKCVSETSLMGGGRLGSSRGIRRVQRSPPVSTKKTIGVSRRRLRVLWTRKGNRRAFEPSEKTLTIKGQITMKELLIGNLINNVSTAINPRDLREALTHMRVLCKPGTLVFTGCNGIKLIEKTYSIETGWNDEIFIPAMHVRKYACLNWDGIKNIKNGLALIRLHNDLIRERFPEQTLQYPNYEQLFRFSHRKGNFRKTIDRRAALDALKPAVLSLDIEDNCRLGLTQLEWDIDKDVNGGFLYQLLKALHSDKLMLRSDTKCPYITFVGENERALLTILRRCPAEL